MANNKKKSKKKGTPSIRIKNNLTRKQKDFCIYYVETGNATEAARRAGYSQKTASFIGNENLTKPYLVEEIERLLEDKRKEQKDAIMTAQEVMEHFTAIARGEEKDQFGLDIAASDRLKALVELAKRTVDLENRANGKADAKVEISLDWTRGDNSESE